MPGLSARWPALCASLLCCASLALAPAAQAAEPTKVRYEEVVRSVLYVPMYVALNQGYFKEAGLDVGMKTSQGTDKGMAALLSNSADIVLIGPEASIYVANSESPVKPKMFAGLTATDGFLLMSRQPVDTFDWSALKGKRVMSFRPGSNPDVFLEAALRKHGLDPKADLTLVSNIGPAARAGAWMAGQADYAIFLEPEAGTLEKAGNGRVVASIGQEVGPVDFTVFTATDAFLTKNPDVAQKWTNAIVRAQEHVQKATPAELAQQVSEFFPAVGQPELAAAIERYRGYGLWKQSPLIEAQAIEQLQDMLITSGVLEPAKRVAYEQVVIADFANAAKP
ncbi:ABC transporter substrate-binding protein [Verticiella sediminum]|uniref:ABC transporter substrate-binding protein n=1 Tax=Verticiella sediminum TaxID=1247510 RepID=A0A556A6J5_9BURK|nr:ABC transporter substrate-binding protein [Verticiella sediminum]TSH88498.1 ABC transporter substrate-binding protein [Verticiella sediminum]